MELIPHGCDQLWHWHAGGLSVQVQGGEQHILREGKGKKLVDQVQQITCAGSLANKSGQKVLYIAECAVFHLEQKGMTLVEIAPGIDLQTDILDQMGFRPLIVKIMDLRIWL